MSTPGPDEFDRIVQGFTAPTTAAPTAPAYDPHPYGAPATHGPKPGLTKRGKAALGIGAVVLAGGGLIAYTNHTAQVAKDQATAKELELKTQALRLEELKEINRAKEIGQKSQSAAETARQASVNSCVNSNKNLVGKGFGSPTYRQVIDDCQAQYGGLAPNLQAAGSSTQATTTTGDGLNGGVLLGIGAAAIVLMWGAKKGTKPTAA